MKAWTMILGSERVEAAAVAVAAVARAAAVAAGAVSVVDVEVKADQVVPLEASQLLENSLGTLARPGCYFLKLASAGCLRDSVTDLGTPCQYWYYEVDPTYLIDLEPLLVLFLVQHHLMGFLEPLSGC